MEGSQRPAAGLVINTDKYLFRGYDTELYYFDDKPTKNRWNFVLQILTAFFNYWGQTLRSCILLNMYESFIIWRV